MKENNLEIGSYVVSTNGRDNNQISVIYKVIDKHYVLLIDGKAKKLDCPKRKNIKHLKSLNVVNEKLANKIEAKTKIFESEVYSCIRKISEGLEITGGNQNV